MKIEEYLCVLRCALEGKKSEAADAARRAIANERANKRETAAQRIENCLRRYAKGSVREMQILNHKTPLPLFRKDPERSLEELFLPESLMEETWFFVNERKIADKLETHQLPVCGKILCEGPPGNGKTHWAEGLANVLQFPFFKLSMQTVLESYLGNTSRTLNAVFENLEEKCVFFLDEIDSIGSERGKDTTKETDRIINALLILIDNLPKDVILVGATNRADLLDEALLDRFHHQIIFPPPSKELTDKFIQYLETKHSMRIPEFCAKQPSFRSIQNEAIKLMKKSILDRHFGTLVS